MWAQTCALFQGAPGNHAEICSSCPPEPYRAALTLLLGNYVGAGVLAWRLPHAFNTRLMVGAHAAVGALAIHYTRRAQADGFSKAAIAGFYKGVWTLFYSEYFLLPFL